VIKKDRPQIRENNFLCKTERDSLTNQFNLFTQLTQSRLSNLGKEHSKKPTIIGMGGKNLHLKSSISKKLLKSFKNANKQKSPHALNTQRKSMHFVEMPRQFSSERFINQSIPERIDMDYISKEKVHRR
jgi:hypothetical protein